ncbi:sigma-54-dependent transcriptional regulator [Fluviispira sanaruensis]|uniref:Sigma-54-dependent Fis family transcriptional regulator n=1 Tax=Fluviispira sanaruensis TaxID=2493639 RepID=A0A4P2VJF5_FLUSA|nr:sigma-54 dependent transcriptional regulator [Fluviispira sanaruensis]BBH51690.1 sigma-54-dependent Fis family transcriptional regulator [Fluviispira sanaruensis]
MSDYFGKILVIDDEKDICSTLSGILCDEGHKVLTANNAESGLKIAKKELPDVCFLDVWLPDIEGTEVLERLKIVNPDLSIIMMSGHANIETAVKCTRLGAMDFIEKPLSLDKVLLSVQNLLRIKNLQFENQNLKNRVEKKYTLLGKSESLQHIISAIDMVAKKNTTILITGENGTGKENVSRLIHEKSNRRNKPFIAINCAAIPEDLIESELFGHEKGAFTGAIGIKRGKFELAHNGTLFLDEIGDMSLKTQSKLLRALQEHNIERLGSDETISVDTRIIAATNKNLEEEIKKGNFREDLFYRINVIPIHLPPLRNRKEDIELISSHYLSLYSVENSIKNKILSPQAIQVLKAYPWPGNVRELKNIMERLSIMVKEDIIEPNHLPYPIHSARADKHEEEFHLFSSDDFREARAKFEKIFIQKKLESYDGNVSKTAESMGMERSHLYRKMKQLGLINEIEKLSEEDKLE